MKSIDQLKNEHEGIKIVFRVLRKMCESLQSNQTIDTTHFEGILDFFQIFVDKCHHGKEEDLLFPAMIQAGIPEQGPIEAMLSEHATGRSHIKTISQAFTRFKSGDTAVAGALAHACEQYILLMLDHIYKENNILYPMGESRFSQDIDEKLFQDFETLEQERIGKGKHEAFHEMINQLNGIYIE
ncbi:MAG: hemerythrin domain-containing protein [Desulfotignum sp.]|nr:hemerythrin domain-containing protein [Desulfotignum sp.]